MTSSNWLPKTWAIAKSGGRVFTSSSMGRAHMNAVRSWDAWKLDHDNDLEDQMREDVKIYLKTAAEMKRFIRSQSWMCFGFFHLTNDSRAAVYWCLAIVVFILMGAVYAWTEDFPGGVNKPQGVCWFDFGTRVAELLLEIGHGVVATGYGGHVQLLSGFLGFTVRIGRAFVIGATVPKSEIKSTRDWYNAIGPAVAQGVKWVFANLAQPWKGIPLCAKGQPFEGLDKVGEGLSQHERRLLLAAVKTSLISTAKLIALWGRGTRERRSLI